MRKRFAGPIRFIAAQERGPLAHDERGSALVETAVSMVILLTLIFGLMEICLALYTYHFVSEAAREGTRFAIVRGSACTSLSGGCPASAAEIQTYVESLGFPGINSSAMKVTTTNSAYPAGGTCTPSASCDNPGNLVQVTVTYKFPLSIPFIKSSTIPMSSTSAMVISN